jgi:ParB family transcriptional regulator, chromosome partitioning protein
VAAKKKPAEKKPAAKKAATTKRPRKKKVGGEAGSRGLSVQEVTSDAETKEAAEVARLVAEDGGEVIGMYRDPIGGHTHVIAVLPIEKVAPTPFQRDLSPAHANRLAEVINKLDRFVDPIVAVRSPEGGFWTPNGNHRLHAMKQLGAKSILALIAPDAEVAYRILALNTEKAHNLREKAMEVIRMARSLAELDDKAEKEYSLEFEEPALLTLGMAYEERGRFSGGAYHSMLKRVDNFFDTPLSKALDQRAERKKLLLELDDAVLAAVARLKERGFTSPYLKAFVVSRINPLRFIKGEPPSYEDLLDRMTKSAAKMDADKVNVEQIATAAGPPEAAEEG